MEQNLPVVAKKVWSLVRVMLFMLRKNICKRKLLLDLNMMMKRGKVATKALQNLMFHNSHNWSSNFAFNRKSHNNSQKFTFRSSHIEDYYEFSCSNSPANPLSLFSTHKKHKNSKKSKVEKGHDEIYVDVAVIKALESMLTSANASPMLPGFGNGKSPMVRQLRITDSPFPLSNSEEDSYVDEAAEKFIMKFYNDLRRQN